MVLGLMASTASLLADPIRFEPAVPSIDRWMYPFNSTPGSRPAAPVFGTYGDDSGVDTRHGQFLLAWDPTPGIPAGHEPRRYLLRSVQLIVQSIREGSFLNDSTPDAYETFLMEGQAGATPDSDPGRPLELFGVGFRGAFNRTDFTAASPFGSAGAGGRNAFAAGFDPQGNLVDVGNNVGKTDPAFPTFPSRPFATSTIPGVGQGDPVPSGSDIVFDLDLSDPLVLGYLRRSLQQGRLWLAVTWLGESNGFSGNPTYPDIATAENLVFAPPRLRIEGTWVSDVDSDADGVPDDWERFHFDSLAGEGTADTDGDGLTTREEWEAGTSPWTADALRLVQESDAEGQPVLRWPGVANRTGVVESSNDLRTWTTATGTFDFREKQVVRWRPGTSAEGAVFYRVREDGGSPLR